jgi:hypothetical protein
MLLRLLPEQVARFWDEIKVGVEAALPPIAGESEDRMNNILTSILSEGIVCWLSYRKHEDHKEVTAIMLTQIVADAPSKTKSVLIYALYSPDDSIGLDGWIEGYRALAEYGRSVGCSRITAYSDNPKIITMAERFRADLAYRFISVPI